MWGTQINHGKGGIGLECIVLYHRALGLVVSIKYFPATTMTLLCPLRPGLAA